MTAYTENPADALGATDALPLVPPGHLTGQVSGSQVDLAWDIVPGATGYDVLRDDVVVSADQPGRSYSDTGLGTGSHVYNVVSVRTVTASVGGGGGTEFSVLGITDTDIQAIPTGTSSWTGLLAMADAAYTVDAASNTVDGVGNAVAGALVYVRTGDTSYKTKVETALDAALAISPASWDQGAANRHLGGWIAAAQLVGRSPYNGDGSLNAWGQWVSDHMTVTHSGGVPRNQVTTDCARGWDNNHGSAARQTLVAAEAYLGLDLTTSYNAMKAYLGGTHADYEFVQSTTPGPGQMGWTDNGGAPSWYVSGHYSGINPSAAWAGFAIETNKDGAIPADVERDGAIYPAIGANGSDHYINGNFYRAVATLVTLAGAGLPLWDYADSAILRARDWAAANIPDHEGDYLGNADPVYNEIYGRSFPAAVGTGENMLVCSAWLTSDGRGVWPRR